ncbi:MAG: TRAP transporter TatT component family protein [Gammaproteobacteria bacterium]|nr:TRAP transporter TatT component family protein [Gammaproteobacteria bacterium]MBU1655910.1 TRAP transporter TatT component family protein [Gammaproteobacteria bacterium]MBU1961782.1 TRAP transporter TatT component family protein [Gammaproteobacteria bacterium]
MKKTILGIALSLSLLLAGPVPAAESTELNAIQSEWARIKYQLPQRERGAAFEALAERAHRLSAAEKTAAPLVWEAIIKASLAGEKGALGGALGYVKEAKSLLERAEAIEPDALDGSIHTSLGSLYYQVPGWPMGFGDDAKARVHLEKAVKLNPKGIDANYFYGDFLLDQGDYKGAIRALEQALTAPGRPGREIADSGRREEIRLALAKARAKMSVNP